MNRHVRPLYLLVMLGVGFVVTLALMGVDRWFIKRRPTELQPAASAPADAPPPRPDPFLGSKGGDQREVAASSSAGARQASS